LKQGVILAAGEGNRLKPFSVSKPKAMITIADKPVIQYVIEALAANGIRDIIIVVGYLKEQIFDALGNGSQLGVSINYVEQNRQLGTAHALVMARDCTDPEFLVLAGNKLIRSQTIQRIVNSPTPAILIKKDNKPSRYGVVTFSNGKVVKIVEKPIQPDGEYINTGIYALNRNWFSVLERELDIPDAINNLILHGTEISVVETSSTWLDIIYPWDILKLNTQILENLEEAKNGIVEPGVNIKGPVSIGKGTVIRSNCYIVGPVAIGKGCQIGPGVCLYPSTSIGNNVSISSFAEIRNSVIEDDVYVEAHSIIQDSIIDTSCYLGTHFCACSEEPEIRIDDHYEKVRTGVIMGRGCNVGNIVDVHAGTIVGNYTRVKSQRQLSGDYPDRSIVV